MIIDAKSVYDAFYKGVYGLLSLQHEGEVRWLGTSCLQGGQLWAVKYHLGFVAAKRKRKLPAPSEDVEPCCEPSRLNLL